jgi:hypothetical protein
MNKEILNFEIILLLIGDSKEENKIIIFLDFLAWQPELEIFEYSSIRIPFLKKNIRYSRFPTTPTGIVFDCQLLSLKYSNKVIKYHFFL